MGVGAGAIRPVRLGLGATGGAIGPTIGPIGLGMDGGVGATGPISLGSLFVGLGVLGGVVLLGATTPSDPVSLDGSVRIGVGVTTTGSSSPPVVIDGAGSGVTCCGPGGVAPEPLQPLTRSATPSAAPAPVALIADTDRTRIDVTDSASSRCSTLTGCTRMPGRASSPRSSSWIWR